MKPGRCPVRKEERRIASTVYLGRTPHVIRGDANRGRTSILCVYCTVSSSCASKYGEVPLVTCDAIGDEIVINEGPRKER